MAATSSSYPPPPPYYRLYKDYIDDPKSAPEPPPAIQGPYLLFGSTYTTDVVLPSLEDQGVRQLYPKGPNIDYKKELRSLNRELQLHILELADVLVERPSQYARRVEDISLIFKNLHHLLNSLRPHQARATLIHILELQIQRRKQAVEDIKNYPYYVPREKEDDAMAASFSQQPLLSSASVCNVNSNSAIFLQSVVDSKLVTEAPTERNRVERVHLLMTKEREPDVERKKI